MLTGYRNIGMVISILRGSSFEVDNHMVSSNLCDKVSITVETSDMEGHSEKSLWRFTLSLLKLRMEVSEIFVVDSAKDEEAGKIKIVCPAPMETYVLCEKARVTLEAMGVEENSNKSRRRFTRLLLKPVEQASKISIVDGRKGEESKKVIVCPTVRLLDMGSF
ncbi:hypothetical protein M9H77_08042 [Catharanthus roseus]|uniref:Uncharacterized protein n=1 Tax=Catharanthus roseus TaxID=4058 RepID=A0ACC0BWL2_CATRO|nr:hypothetical protein M9H77_08042 [Catharanthus roseus]